jgi:uncharacterized delta-60 repeat protein
MKQLYVEPLERRTLLSTHNSVSAAASINYGEDPEVPTVSLSWTRAATTPIDGFDILRSDDGGMTYDSVGTSTDSSFTDEDALLEEDAQYSYQVCPFTNAGGDQLPLGTASVRTPLGIPGLQLSSSQDGSVTAECTSETISTQSFKLRWWPANDPSNSHSKVINQLQEQDDALFQISYAYTDVNGLNPAKNYDFSLTQFDGFATSDAQTGSTIPFSAPDNVQARVQNDQSLLITWQDDPTIATGFRVTWTWPSGSSFLSRSTTVGRNARGAVISGLLPGIDYGISVQAMDGKTESDPSLATTDAEIDPPLDLYFNGSDEDFDETPVTTSFANHSPATANATALQPDGDLIVAGTAHHNFVVARYLPSGGLDPLFGNNGRVTIDFGGTDSATGVAVRANGDILITGTSDRSFAMADLKSNGTLNHAFGHNGRIGYFNGQSLNASTLALASDDGGFFIGGIATSGSAHSAIVQQFQANGIANSVWDSATARIPNVTGAQTAMAIQSTQKVILACQMGNGIVISRFNRDGSVDASFGAGGEKIVYFGTSTQDVFGMAIDPRNNSIVLSGSAGSGAQSTFAIARLTANGRLDTTFNGTGEVQSFVKNAHASAHAVAVLPSGNVVAVGTANGNFAIAEFTPSGQLDKHFDSDGLATTDQGSPTDIATSLASPNDGSLYLAGTSGDDFSVAHYFIDAG